MVSIVSRVQQDTILTALTRTSKKAASALTELSTGLRSGANDAVTLGRIQQIQAQISGIDTANSNITVTSSMLQTAEGGLNQTMSQLQSLRSYAVAASSATLSGTERASLQLGANVMLASIDSTASSTIFNNQGLIDGSFGTQMVQVGPNSGDQIAVTLSGARTSDLGLSSFSLGSVSSSTAAINAVDSAIAAVSSQIADAASAAVRMESAYTTNQTTALNLTAATSNLGDSDLAEITARVQQLSIQQQAQTLLLKVESKTKRTLISTLL